MNSSHAKKLFILLSLMEEMGFTHIDAAFKDSVGLENGYFDLHLRFELNVKPPEKLDERKKKGEA